jgi:hypothetical protein
METLSEKEARWAAVAASHTAASSDSSHALAEEAPTQSATAGEANPEEAGDLASEPVTSEEPPAEVPAAVMAEGIVSPAIESGVALPVLSPAAPVHHSMADAVEVRHGDLQSLEEAAARIAVSCANSGFLVGEAEHDDY